MSGWRATWVVSDNQVRRLRKLMLEDNRVAVNAAKVGMDEKTARKYLNDDGGPVRSPPHTHGERARIHLRRYGPRSILSWS
jgi:hypothetical protein